MPSEAYTWRNVTILGGGFVTGLVFNTGEKDLLYARTDIGGAYRFNPADKTWIPLLDHISREDSNFLGVESIGVDPVEPNRVYLAVGTYTQDWAGTGAILRSTDKGSSWERTDMPIKMGGNENGRGNGERLAVDPNKHDIVLFGSRKNGLFLSNDAGKTWEKESGFPESEEPLGVGITFVLFDKASGKKGEPTPVIYAGFASTEKGLYRSTDAGKSFEPVVGQPKGMMPSHGGFDSEGVLYLSYGDKPGPSEVKDGAVFSYSPKAKQFKNITPVNPRGKDRFGYGGLAVDPSSKGVVVVTTIDRWTAGDEIFRTTNGGRKWTAIGPKVVRDDGGAKYLYWGRDKPSATGWMADIAIDPFNNARGLYVTGQGVWMTEDFTEADAGKPTHFAFTNRGLEETAVLGITSPPKGPHLLSAVGDICGFRHDDLDNPPKRGMFTNPICGNASSIDFAESKPELVVRVGTAGGNEAKGAFSNDSGTTWTPFGSLPKGGKEAGDIVISADGATLLWAAKEATPAFSTDQGKTWTTCKGLTAAPKLPGWAPVNFRPAADRVNPKTFYIYDAIGGKAYTSNDGGVSFESSPSSLPTRPDWGLTPTSARAVPGHDGDVWVTTGNQLYRSTDSGKTYSAVDGVDESYAVGFGKPKEGTSYPAVYLSAKIGGTQGLFRSDDEGKSFVRIDDDAHRYGTIDKIVGDPRVYGRVYAGTQGRGVVYGEPAK